MPIYEYACQSCGAEIEIWQKISEKPKKVCPECGAHKLERLISHTSFQLKGSGWYVTDYARKDQSGPSKSKAKAKEKADKPAAKTDD